MASAKKQKAPVGIDAHHGTWRYRFKLQGQPRVAVVTGLAATRENLAAVKRLRDEHRASAILGRAVPVQAVPFNEAADRFLAEKTAEHRSKPATWKRIRTSLASWRAFLGNRMTDTLTKGDVRDYLTWRRESGVQEVTLRKDFLTGRMLAEFCRDHRWLDGDPFSGVETPSDRDSRNELTLTDAELAVYFAEADQHHAVGDVARLILHQGLRPDCEALQIRVEDVDIQTGVVRVPQSKSRASKRDLMLSPECRVILGRRIGTAPGPWIFPGRKHISGRRYRELADRPLSYSGIVSAHNRILARLTAAGSGVPEFGLYSLRHTFATRFYDAVHDLVALKDALGHADLRTVMRYVHDGKDRMARAMELFQASPKSAEGEAIQ